MVALRGNITYGNQQPSLYKITGFSCKTNKTQPIFAPPRIWNNACELPEDVLYAMMQMHKKDASNTVKAVLQASG